MNQGVGANKGPGLLRAREQIGKVLRKIHIFSGPRGENLREIKGIGGIPRVYSGVWWQALADTVLGGLFPPLYSGVFSPACPAGGRRRSFFIAGYSPLLARRKALLRLKTLA